MRWSLFNGVRAVLALGFLALSVVACNTTKATVDTVVKFTSSTSPDSMFNQDGIVEDQHKLTLYTAVVYDNLQQDIARGNGEYLASLGALLSIPKDRGDDWQEFAQARYSVVYPDDGPASQEIVARLSRELAAGRNVP